MKRDTAWFVTGVEVPVEVPHKPSPVEELATIIKVPIVLLLLLRHHDNQNLFYQVILKKRIQEYGYMSEERNVVLSPDTDRVAIEVKRML